MKIRAFGNISISAYNNFHHSLMYYPSVSSPFPSHIPKTPPTPYLLFILLLMCLFYFSFHWAGAGNPSSTAGLFLLTSFSLFSLTFQQAYFFIYSWIKFHCICLILCIHLSINRHLAAGNLTAQNNVAIKTTIPIASPFCFFWYISHELTVDGSWVYFHFSCSKFKFWFTL